MLNAPQHRQRLSQSLDELLKTNSVSADTPVSTQNKMNSNSNSNSTANEANERMADSKSNTISKAGRVTAAEARMATQEAKEAKERVAAMEAADWEYAWKVLADEGEVGRKSRDAFRNHGKNITDSVEKCKAICMFGKMMEQDEMEKMEKFETMRVAYLDRQREAEEAMAEFARLSQKYDKMCKSYEDAKKDNDSAAEKMGMACVRLNWLREHYLQQSTNRTGEANHLKRLYNDSLKYGLLEDWDWACA
jgi:myosin heavy subunit